MKREPSCKDCTERFPGCHSKCEKYIKWKAELEELKARQPNTQEAARLLYEGKVKFAVKKIVTNSKKSQ